MAHLELWTGLSKEENLQLGFQLTVLSIHIILSNVLSAINPCLSKLSSTENLELPNKLSSMFGKGQNAA